MFGKKTAQITNQIVALTQKLDDLDLQHCYACGGYFSKYFMIGGEPFIRSKFSPLVARITGSSGPKDHPKEICTPFFCKRCYEERNGQAAGKKKFRVELRQVEIIRNDRGITITYANPEDEVAKEAKVFAEWEL